MKSFLFKRQLKALGTLLFSLLTAPVAALEPATIMAVEQLGTEVGQKGALVLGSVGASGDEPLYAGSTTLLLLIIAFLGSVAVKRRTEAVTEAVSD